MKFSELSGYRVKVSNDIPDRVKQAFRKYGTIRTYASSVNLATMNEAFAMGLDDFYYPVKPDFRVQTANEERDIIRIIENLEIQHVFIDMHIMKIEPDYDLIACRNTQVRKLLVEKFPEVKVIKGKFTAEDVRGKNVIGILSPDLAAECATYRHVLIFNGFTPEKPFRENLLIKWPAVVCVKDSEFLR
jgi:hypothetical protein